ncbi:MAG: ribonuclease P protein component [Lachnospiraceae bacterium]|nr:ribonuclease P protein component [Lachnospiraceae bacterium]
MKFSDSLKKNRDFQNVYRRGTSTADKYFVMYALKNGTECNRIGISASKKVGNSVVRHTIARRIREAYRLQEELFCRGYDVVFIARFAAKDCTQKQAEESVRILAEKQHILEDKK